MPYAYRGIALRTVPAMFAALGNKNRRAILAMISSDHLSGSDMAQELGISQQAVSRHIRILERAGLVSRLGWEGYGVDSGGINELLRFIQREFRPPDDYTRRPHWM